MSRRILIIDDDKTDQELIVRALGQAGFEDPEVASDGEEGIEKAKSFKPDVILLDTLMPKRNGFEVCRSLRQIKELTSKIIIMTGNIDGVDAVRAKREGADDYVVKTADYAYLINAINSL